MSAAKPLDWYHLIREADEFSERTGWGLANFWSFANRGQYGQACEVLNLLLAGERSGSIKPSQDGIERKVREHEHSRAEWRARHLERIG